MSMDRDGDRRRIRDNRPRDAFFSSLELDEPYIPEPIRQWLELTQLLIGAAVDYAGTPPDANSTANIRRVNTAAASLVAALTQSQRP